MLAASFPCLLLLAVQKSERGPGIIYHVSDVEGREDLIECRQIVDVLTHTVAQSTIHVGVFWQSFSVEANKAWASSFVCPCEFYL